MRPTFSYAIKYNVEIQCISPLRTGGSKDPQQILRRADGTPFLQGASLAGAMRNWKNSDILFGRNENEGQLSVSDLIFPAEMNKNANLQITRPHLRIDGATGTAADRAKFDVAHISANAKGRFTLLWRGLKGEEEKAASEIETYLAALHSGEILLGAQKTNGFGRVELLVKKQTYDLYNRADREAWLNNTGKGSLISLNKKSDTSKTEFIVRAYADSLLIKASVGTGVGETGIDSVQLRENGRPVLPGSSIKGVIRSHITKIAPYCGVSNETIDDIFGCSNSADDNAIAGKAIFSEAYLKSDEEQPFKNTRIRINRFSGGVIRKGLFSEKPESGNCELKISIPAKEVTGCMLLFYALRDLGMGLYSIGSGNNVGYGRLNVENIKIKTPCGEAQLLFNEEKTVLEDPDSIITGWRAALGGAE